MLTCTKKNGRHKENKKDIFSSNNSTFRSLPTKSRREACIIRAGGISTMNWEKQCAPLGWGEKKDPNPPNVCI